MTRWLVGCIEEEDDQGGMEPKPNPIPNSYQSLLCYASLRHLNFLRNFDLDSIPCL